MLDKAKMEKRKIPNAKSDYDEVQPVDGYVKELLEYAVKRYNVNVDLESPTRGQRLEAALAMQKEANGFSSMEIMVGRRISSNETDMAFLLMAQKMCPGDPRHFYEGFAHQYWPKEETPKKRRK